MVVIWEDWSMPVLLGNKAGLHLTIGGLLLSSADKANLQGINMPCLCICTCCRMRDIMNKKGHLLAVTAFSFVGLDSSSVLSVRPVVERCCRSSSKQMVNEVSTPLKPIKDLCAVKRCCRPSSKQTASKVNHPLKSIGNLLM